MEPNKSEELFEALEHARCSVCRDVSKMECILTLLTAGGDALVSKDIYLPDLADILTDFMNRIHGGLDKMDRLIVSRNS